MKAQFKCLKHHWTMKHGKMMEKRVFTSFNEAVECMKKEHINPNIFAPYKCVDCGMWHIGHIKVKVLKDKNKHK